MSLNNDLNPQLLELVEKVKQLFQQIQQLPTNSNEYCQALKEYRQALNELLIPINETLLNLYPKPNIAGKDFLIPEEMLGFYYKLKLNVHLLQNLCSDAHLQTIKDAEKIIQKFDSTKGSSVINWFKGAFEGNLRNCLKKHLNCLKKQKKMKREISYDRNNFSALSDENEKDSRSYLRVVQEDPEGLLASINLTYTNQKTNVQESISLKDILLMISKGKKVMDIHRELNISPKSIYSLIERNVSPVKETDSKKQKSKKQRIRDYFAKYSH